MSGKPRRRSLFTRVGGGPMCFSLMPCPERNEIRQLIERGGGVLLQPDTMPDAIRLVPSSITTLTDSGGDVFSVDYIRACSEKNRWCPRQDFKVPTPPIVPGDSKERTPRPVRSRRGYTLGEDIAIARYIAKQPGVRIKGNAVYKEMAAAGIVPGKHSWQSLKQRYLKAIQPMRQLYESPEPVSSLVERLARESRRARGSSRRNTPEQCVLVEDSEGNDSYKRRKQAAHELESSKGSSTECEAVAESRNTPLETPAREETKDETRKRRNRNSNSISLFASSSLGASSTQNAGRKGDEIRSTKRRQNPGQTPTGKLKLRTSLWRAQQRAPRVSSNIITQARCRSGTDSSAACTTDTEMVVRPSPSRSNKQKTLPTTLKASKMGVHAQSVEIDSDCELEISPGLVKSTTKATRHKAHGSDRLRKQSSWQSSSGRLEHVPSPGNTCQPMQSPLRKRGRPICVENSVGQSSTHPNCGSNNVGTCETDLENPPIPVCVAEESYLPTAASLGGRKKKSVPSPCKSYEEQALHSAEQAMPPKERRNSSRLCLRKKHASLAKGGNGGLTVDSSVTKALNSGCAPKHQLPSSPPKERKRITSPADHGGHLSSLSRLESGPPEADLRDRPRRAHASENSGLQQTTRLPERPKKRSVPSRYRQSNRTKQASTEEREMETSMWTGTPSLVHKRNEPLCSAKDSDEVSDADSCATSAVNSTRSRKHMPTRCRDLRRLLLSARKRMGTSPTASDSRSSSHLCLKSSDNDGTASETDSEDPLELFYVVKGSLLRATLLREQSKAKGVLSRRRGSSKEVACLEEHESSTRTNSSALREQTRPTRFAEKGGNESAASVIIIESSSECLEEDVPWRSQEDGVASEHEELSKLLGFLKEGKNQPVHASAACPFGCNCPFSTGYIRAAREAAALSAFLAYHDRPLPASCPKDPMVSLLLEVLLRRLEGGNAEDASS